MVTPNTADSLGNIRPSLAFLIVVSLLGLMALLVASCWMV